MVLRGRFSVHARLYVAVRSANVWFLRAAAAETKSRVALRTLAKRTATY